MTRLVTILASVLIHYCTIYEHNIVKSQPLPSTTAAPSLKPGCDPTIFKYAVYEGNPGLLFYEGKLNSSTEMNLHLIRKPLDEHHSFNYSYNCAGKNISLFKKPPQIISALYSPNGSNTGYWGIVSPNETYFWPNFSNYPDGSIQLYEVMKNLDPLNQYPNAVFSSTFTFPFEDGLVYCSSFFAAPDPTSMLVCFDSNGNVIFENNTFGAIEAIDLFDWSEDDLMGVYFQNYQNIYWYRYFRIEKEINQISFTNIGPWFHQTEPFHNCLINFCNGFEFEIAFKVNSTFFIASGNRVISPKNLMSAAGPSRQVQPDEEAWVDKRSITALNDNLWYYQNGVLKMIQDPGEGTIFPLDKHLGAGLADAAFTLTYDNNTRVYFFKDSHYFTMLYDTDGQTHQFTYDYDYDQNHNDLNNNPDDLIHHITDFNTFRYLDSAVEMSDQQIVFFYGYYYMMINNWTEEGYPVPEEYSINLIAETLLDCDYLEIWSNSPYKTYDGMIQILQSQIPGRYKLPPDKSLLLVLYSLGIIVTGFLIVIILSIIYACCCCKAYKDEPIKIDLPPVDLDDKSSSSSNEKNSLSKKTKTIISDNKSKLGLKEIKSKNSKNRVGKIKSLLKVIKKSKKRSPEGKAGTGKTKIVNENRSKK